MFNETTICLFTYAQQKSHIAAKRNAFEGRN